MLRNTFLVTTLLLSSLAFAAPPNPEFPGTGFDSNLAVSAVDGSSDNNLTWNEYTGFRVFGYDIYYSSAPRFPGDNSGRIETGANNGRWLDVGGRTAGRCEATDYYIVAYSRGRKNYSDPDSGSGTNLCGTADDIPPVVTIDIPTEGQSYAGTQLFEGSATDEGGSSLASVSVVAENQDSNESQEFTPAVSADRWLVNADLAEGSYVLTVFALDTAGNMSAAEFASFVVLPPVDDTASPVLSISEPVENQEYLSSTQLLSGTVDDFGGSGVAVVQLTLSGDASLSTSAPVTDDEWALTTTLGSGAYVLNASAIDRAGNTSLVETRAFTVNYSVAIGEDGYSDVETCSLAPIDPQRPNIAPNTTPIFQSLFDGSGDIHTQLAQNWKSAYEWRNGPTDVIINNESQFYLDVLGFDAAYRQAWSPFEQLVDDSNNGYLAIHAAKASILDSGPFVNGAPFAGQSYLSGVLTSFDTQFLSPAASPTGKTVVELRARMPRGQGTFPAAWLYNKDLQRVNPEIDIYEYVGQSPDGAGWKRPGSPECGSPCMAAGRENYDTFDTQYHNFYTRDKGKLRGIGPTSVDNNGNPTGAIYTNDDGGTWWRGAVWQGCSIDFSEKFHLYTLEWSADEIVWYIDNVEVLRLDELADSGGNLPNVNFVPVDTRSMYLTLNFALGSVDSYIGAPDAYTKQAMYNGELRYIIDYIKVWQ